MLLEGSIVVLDCVVSRPAVTSSARGASQLTGFAAANAETSKDCDLELFGDSAGCESVLLDCESLKGSVKRQPASYLCLVK